MRLRISSAFFVKNNVSLAQNCFSAWTRRLTSA